jgi:hypothetical protein
MRLVIIYLFWGVVWDVVLNFVSTITDSENKLTSYERVYSLVLWPISFCIFMYHFIKTFFKR